MPHLAIYIFSFFQSIMLVLLLTGTSIAQDIPPDDEAIPSLSSREYIDFLNSGPLLYRAKTMEGLDILNIGLMDQAYSIWVEQGLGGDLNALALAAMLCKAAETLPASDWMIRWGSDKNTSSTCPVPSLFWENSLISLLGEGEGNFILGLFGIELGSYAPFQTKNYVNTLMDYMLRSARAGHPHAMYLASSTSSSRTSQIFTPPKNLPDVPVLPQKYHPTRSFEARFWLTQAAHAGNQFSMEVLGSSYGGKHAKIEPDIEKMKYYYEMSVAHASNGAAKILATEYVTGAILPQDCYKVIYYCSIAAQLENSAKFFPGSHLDDYFFARDKLPLLKEDLINFCMTEAEYEQAIAESIPAFEAIKAVRDQERAAHQALYDAAHARLPEVRAAYEQALRENSGGR